MQCPGGVWTVKRGYGRAEIANAVRDQLDQAETLLPGSAGSNPGAMFSERLIAKMPGLQARLLIATRAQGEREGFQMGPEQFAHKRLLAARSNKIL